MRIASWFHPKAKKWVEGSKNWHHTLQDIVGDDSSNWIWFHCASLGEFEQGRNVIEALKQYYPKFRILLTFYSPSGYEIRKNYQQVDGVMYMPLDILHNAKEFVRMLDPKVVFIVKNELWLNFLHALRSEEIPTVLVSARLREKSAFLTSFFAPLYKQALQEIKMIFCQDPKTRELLLDFCEEERLCVSSDTRYDRVLSNAGLATTIPEIEQFLSGRLCLMAGSTWAKGEEMLFEVYEILRKEKDFCMILAPHEIKLERIDRWIEKYPDQSVKLSSMATLQEGHRILWIDNIGMLSKLYQYADIAYVGGGWGTGLHNILEPAVFGCPVFFGPKHEKFPEAKEMMEDGGAFDIPDPQLFVNQLRPLIHDENERKLLGQKNAQFIKDRAGATQVIMDWFATLEIHKLKSS